MSEIVAAVGELKQMGYEEDPPIEDADRLPEARKLVLNIAAEGESLLLLHRRLAQSRWASVFIAQKGLFEDWDSYIADGRIYCEVGEFVSATESLMEGFDHFDWEDRKLFDELAIPDFLLQDFKLARDLFSVGFDEVGALMAGRGLEGVLRHFAAIKDIRVLNRGKAHAASEVDFRDLVETFYRLRWSRDRSRLIDQDTKSLLDLLRTVRNSTAHPSQRRHQPNWRELAVVMSASANALWKDAQRKRARLVSKIIERDW